MCEKKKKMLLFTIGEWARTGRDRRKGNELFSFKTNDVPESRAVRVVPACYSASTRQGKTNPFLVFRAERVQSTRTRLFRVTDAGNDGEKKKKNVNDG